jgi:hypothetical protein
MKQLILGMYDDRKSQLFGLWSGQIRCRDKFTHNSGWYNRKGEKLGWGDLNAKDFRRISNEIAKGEMFIVLGEIDVESRLRGTSLDPKAPGIDYAADRAIYMIKKGHVYKVSDYSSDESYEMYGVKLEILRHQQLLELLSRKK